jgi:oligopeptide/dipeptide ABC transporter ATP-binding protein
MAEQALLTVRGLKKDYPRTGGWIGRSTDVVKAVDGIDLDVGEGETFGVVGESGCGKSTLGRCILRLEEPSSGSILYRGQDLLRCDAKALRSLRREMQIVFQDPYSSLDPRQTVGRIIAEPFMVHHQLERDKLRLRIEELMSLVGLLPEHLSRYPHEFSGGQRQRICIARALALHPKLIIADEPISALDVSIQAQILNLLVDLGRRFGLTYIFISHDLRVVRHFCDRMAVMYLGRIVEIAPTTKIYGHAMHHYTRALLDAVPRVNPNLRKERAPLEGDVPSPINPPSGCTFHPRCPGRQDVCAGKAPVLSELEPGHWVACYFPKTEGVK